MTTRVKLALKFSLYPGTVARGRTTHLVAWPEFSKVLFSLTPEEVAVLEQALNEPAGRGITEMVVAVDYRTFRDALMLRLWSKL